MAKMKDKLGKIGRELDESIKEKETFGIKIAKATAKKAMDTTTTVAANISKSVGKKIKNGTKRIKEDLKIEDGMTAGQKAGKVVEKFVDIIDRGVQSVVKKINESQADRFATIGDLKTNIDKEILIGKERGAITKDRAKACKEFLLKISKDKESRPYALKDMRKTIIRDVVMSASTNWDELIGFLLDKEVPESKAAVDFLEKEIKIVKEVKEIWLQKQN